jgi:hypothetical protein
MISAVQRRLLGAVLAFLALNAVAGGFYGLSGAPGVPLEWLQGSPFSSYIIPSWILLMVVGGSLAIAAFAVLSDLRHGRLLSLAAGTILLFWIGAQVAIIGYVSWMQPATACAGLAILWLASTRSDRR